MNSYKIGFITISRQFCEKIANPFKPVRNYCGTTVVKLLRNSSFHISVNNSLHISAFTFTKPKAYTVRTKKNAPPLPHLPIFLNIQQNAKKNSSVSQPNNEFISQTTSTNLKSETQLLKDDITARKYALFRFSRK